MKAVYRSKTDTWLVALLTVAIIASSFAAIKVLSVGTLAAWAIAVFIVTIGAGLPLWLLFSTFSILEHTQLMVQSGPFKWRIPVADITSVKPSRNPLSSPALSLDRLRIDYGQGRSLMISPSNKDQFVRDIEIIRRGNAQ